MSDTGWPRPWAPWTPGIGSTFVGQSPRTLPVPWAAETTLGMVDFGALRREARSPGHLCQVCGLELGETVLFGMTQLPEMGETSGPGCHPRCFALALKHCPHFAARYSEDEAVAYLYRGPGPGFRCDQGIGPITFHVSDDVETVTRAEVRELVRASRRKEER